MSDPLAPPGVAPRVAPGELAGTPPSQPPYPRLFSPHPPLLPLPCLFEPRFKPLGATVPRGSLCVAFSDLKTSHRRSSLPRARLAGAGATRGRWSSEWTGGRPIKLTRKHFRERRAGTFHFFPLIYSCSKLLWNIFSISFMRFSHRLSFHGF